ncbi:hypothetical protein GCM10010451_38250 [Streptomyces virens]|uniref:Transposase n=2 Tax=Streptomyces TaxID=1883 RepID=A0ABP6PPT9_9ACTN
MLAGSFARMRSTPPSSARRWDGSPVTVPPRRSLRVACDGTSRLLRCGQVGRCRDCGNRIEWYHRSTEQSVRLHPHELPSARVPAACRWHVSSGIAHPAEDGSGWCRVPHAAVCPAREASRVPPQLVGLRRALAVNTRRLIDAGAFTPPARPADGPVEGRAACRPARPIVQMLYVRYLAAHPVDEIQCVTQTRRRHRCPSPLLAPGTPAGIWRLIPATAAAGQLALPAEVMAVYDLTTLPYAEQMRWRAQHCPQHAATPTAADLAVADWTPFDPLHHGEHIHTRLPAPARHHRPVGRSREVGRP